MGIIQGRKIQMLLKKMKNRNNSKGYTSLHEHQQISIHEQTAVPSGHFPIYVGEELKRYAVPVAYLSSRWLQDLLNKFEDEIQGGQPRVAAAGFTPKLIRESTCSEIYIYELKGLNDQLCMINDRVLKEDNLRATRSSSARLQFRSGQLT
ncbi:hypothetical protein LguiB_031707 [Lonicera macranthoides]